MTRGPDRPASHTSSGPEEPTHSAKIQALVDRILAMDKSMDQVRVEKIAKIKKALANGTYHVSAADVARKIIDHMQEPLTVESSQPGPIHGFGRHHDCKDGPSGAGYARALTIEQALNA
jgi:flagellar biosynthesis anti-sigma factor FlgM